MIEIAVLMRQTRYGSKRERAAATEIAKRRLRAEAEDHGPEHVETINHAALLLSCGIDPKKAFQC